MITTKALILAPIWSAGLVAGTLIVSAVGPDVEERMAPIITAQSIGKRWRTADEACWDWTYTKARDATFVRETFVIERPDGIRYPTQLLRPDLGIPTNDSTTAKGGTRRTIPQCVTVPASLKDGHFVVRGHKFYQPWHGRWQLDQPIEPVVFGDDVAVVE